MSKEVDKLEDKVEEKLEKIADKLSSIDKTLAKQATQLELHIYRTNLAEENIEILREELKPVQAHVSQLNGVLKFFGAIAVVAGIVKAVIEVWKLF